MTVSAAISCQSETKMKLIARPSLKPSSFERLRPDRFDKIHLYSSVENEHWHYELKIVDRKVDNTNANRILNACAVLLIPAGRETEYLFSSRRGLLNIAESAKCVRLIAVSFQRSYCFKGENPYQSQQHVQAELTASVQIIAQQGKFLGDVCFEEKFQIPFMAVDGIGHRDVIARGETTTTGPYIVEQVLVSDDILRRLYFMRNPNVIQTEVYMKKEYPSEVDRLKLGFGYHMHIVAGYILLGNTPSQQQEEQRESLVSKEKAIIIGLGGGGLHNFLQIFFRSKLRVTAIELDPGVVEIARKHFGLEESESSLDVIVGDGLEVGPASMASPSGQEKTSTSSSICFPPSSMSLIVIDVDSKDTSVGMSCPPVSFVDISYLRRLKKLLVVDGGILAINVSARDPDMLMKVQQSASEVFSAQCVFMAGDLDDEDEYTSSDALNVVIFAKNISSSECSACALPTAMEITDKIYKVCDDNEIFDFELRGKLEQCSTDIKRLVSKLTKDSSVLVTSGKKSGKKKAKGKKKK